MVSESSDRLEMLRAMLANAVAEHAQLNREVEQFAAEEERAHRQHRDAIYRRNAMWRAMDGLQTTIDDMERATQPQQVAS